jgi:hypothetical protein
MTISLFLLIHSQKIVFNKKYIYLKLTALHQAVTKGSLRCCTSLSLRLRQDCQLQRCVAYLHLLGSCFFFFTCARKLLILIYTCQEAFVSYLHVIRSYCFLFTRARKLLILIYMYQEAFVSCLHVVYELLICESN